jgi:hypothetical protein
MVAMNASRRVTAGRTVAPGRATARRVCIPDDVDGTIEKASGNVRLPLHVNWSDTETVYDLSDRRERASVYEQVLREGTEDDIRHFIRIDELIDLWDELVLPDQVRRDWAEWLRERRGIVVAC